jgi:DNA adenine methylase
MGVTRGTAQAKPVVKWAGGKQSLARQLVRFFPPDFSTYYEPCVGGASVLLVLHPTRAVIGDLNDWLLDTYEAIRADCDRVADILDGLRNTKKEYHHIRAMPPESLDLFHRAAHLIYLNKTCFRGLFRVNRHGQFNVPYGAYRRRYYDRANLRAVADALRSAKIHRGDLELCLAGVRPTDFVYLDPPYHQLGGYSDFNRYTRFQFRENDHVRLAAVCRKLDERGIRWAVSNSDTPFVRALFKGYRMVCLSTRREINLDSAKRDVSELLILNYQEADQRHVERLLPP